MAGIAERKNSEENLRTTLGCFHTILSVFTAVCCLLTTLTLLIRQQAFCDLYDLDDPPDQLCGITASEMIAKTRGIYAKPEETAARIMEVVGQNRPVKSAETSIVGGRTYLIDSLIPILVEGKPYGRFWHHTDISERKKAEDAVRQSEEKFANVFQKSPIPMTISNVDDGAFININDKFCQVVVVLAVPSVSERHR